MKKFVIDSSVPLYDSEALRMFGKNEVIIPSIVLEEINQFKDEQSERGFHAVEFSKTLEKLTKKGKLRDGVYLNDTLIRTSYDVDNNELKKTLKYEENDYNIIACAINHDAILVTRDRMMRVIANDFVKAENYQADELKVKKLYKGYRIVKSTEEEIAKLYQAGLCNGDYNLYPNEFIILENAINPEHRGIGINKNGTIIPCNFDRMNTNGLKLKLKPLSLEQKMLLYLLLDEDIKCVTIAGKSGKGKTLLSVDVALASVFRGLYNQFVFTKSVKPVDSREELGYYRGGPDEKLEPHMRPLYSAIEFLYKKELYNSSTRRTVKQKIEELTEQDFLNVIPLAHIRGDSIFNKFTMLDEAQNTTKYMMKALVTRLEASSKLIASGDIDQIDDKHLNPYNTGLTHLIEAGKDEDFIAHITLDLEKDSERGPLATFGTNKL